MKKVMLNSDKNIISDEKVEWQRNIIGTRTSIVVMLR